MSEKVWRLYASKEITVYTSSSVNDPLAAEECRAWATNWWHENPPPAGSVVISRVKTGVAGRHSVRLVIPGFVADYEAESDARTAQTVRSGAVVVKIGSDEELAVLALAKEVSRYA
jgi:hypothetical protein